MAEAKVLDLRKYPDGILKLSINIDTWPISTRSK